MYVTAFTDGHVEVKYISAHTAHELNFPIFHYSVQHATPDPEYQDDTSDEEMDYLSYAEHEELQHLRVQRPEIQQEHFRPKQNMWHLARTQSTNGGFTPPQKQLIFSTLQTHS
jgi:hypothetical protein